MKEPIKLVTPPTADRQTRESVIGLLRDALVEAEAGNVDMVIIMSRHINGDWTDRASQDDRFTDTIGRIEIVKAQMMALYLGRKGK